MKKQVFFLVAFLLLHSGKDANLYAQHSQSTGRRGQAMTDSLRQELSKTKDDTNKVNLLLRIGHTFYGSAPDSAIKYSKDAVDLAKKIDWKKGIATGNNLLGSNLMAKSEIARALDYFQASLDAYVSIHDTDGMSHLLHNLAIVYIVQGEYPKALDYSLKALKMDEAQGSKDKLAKDYGMVGAFYLQTGDCTKALEYTLKSLTINEELRDTSQIITNLDNLGSISNTQKDYSRALEYYFRSLHLSEILGSRSSMALTFGNIGSVYTSQKNYATALAYGFKSLRYQDPNDTGQVARENGNIGQVYLAIAQDTGIIKQDSLIPVGKTANVQKAIYYLKLSLVPGKDILDLNSIKTFSLNLSEAEALIGNYKEAFENYTRYVSAKDSLFSIESKKKISSLEANHEVELKEKKIQVQDLQIVAAKNERKYYMAGLGMLILVSIGLFGRYRILNRNKKQLEDKNRLIAAEKENADTQRMRAENSERVKQQFLANMSHEIRTPMNAVSGMTDLLIAKQPRPDQLNYLKVISKSSDILLHIINDILDLSKIEVGKMELEKIDFSLAETIAQVRDTLSFRSEEKGLQLITTIDDKVNDILLGDPFRLNQILINLGGNAIKFTQKGSVEIRIDRISEERGVERLKFSIIDTGIGIPADKLKNLFDSFKQVNRSDTRKYGGTGLGLSISKQLVELQGGSITVESIEGSGTVFSFVLDYPAGSKEQLSLRIRNEQKADGSMLNGLRILLADDNEYNRLVVAETLHLKAEVTIDEAVNGLKAIQLMEKNDYDVVLMDVQMPEMNGFEATDYIRAKLPAPKNQVPVIALTASMLRLDIELCYQHGMNTFIPKPFKAWQLIAAIAEQTGRKQAAALQAIKDETIESNAIVTGGVTDLTYLAKFCEGDDERIKKYIEIYLAAVPGFADKIQVAIAAKDFMEIAALMHTFKPKWMMMGMKQTMELGQKIEILCNEMGHERKISEYLVLLVEQNESSVKELENKS